MRPSLCSWILLKKTKIFTFFEECPCGCSTLGVLAPCACGWRFVVAVPWLAAYVRQPSHTTLSGCLACAAGRPSVPSLLPLVWVGVTAAPRLFSELFTFPLFFIPFVGFPPFPVLIYPLKKKIPLFASSCHRRVSANGDWTMAVFL